MKKIISFILTSFFLVGCSANTEYYKAVQKQNEVLMQQQIAKEKAEREEDNRHQEMMMNFLQKSTEAAAKTPEITDDILVPMLVMNMEQQRLLAKALQAPHQKGLVLHEIKAPETAGEFMKNSTSLVLGGLGIYAGLKASDNLVDLGIAGLNAAGNKLTVSGNNNKVNSDSFKNGTDNTITDSDHINLSGKSCATCGENEEKEGEKPNTDPEKFDLDECIANPPGGYNPKGDPLWTPAGCSCKSHSLKHC